MTASVTLRTQVADADVVAAALQPDNTNEMTTHAEDGVVVTRIERESASGLQSTVDDYLVNLQVATHLLDHNSSRRDGSPRDGAEVSRSESTTNGVLE